MSHRSLSSGVKLLLAFSVAIGTTPRDACASLISVGTAFGPNTATLDTSTGLSWLDLTLTTGYSYDELLTEAASGGAFAGFGLATQDEVLAFWVHAGIDVESLGLFTPANLQPIMDLMLLVGTTGLNSGNLGNGNSFDFTAGHIESGPAGGGGWVRVMTIAADPDPTRTGRPDVGMVPSNNTNNERGAWLVGRRAPEPRASIMFSAGLVLLMIVRCRRR